MLEEENKSYHYLFLVRPTMTKNCAVKIDFSLGIKPFDASQQKIPVLIVGNIRLIKLLQFNDVKTKLEPFVTQEVCVYMWMELMISNNRLSSNSHLILGWTGVQLGYPKPSTQSVRCLLTLHKPNFSRRLLG